MAVKKASSKAAKPLEAKTGAGAAVAERSKDAKTSASSKATSKKAKS